MSFGFKQLKDDAVALVDVFAPSDFILNSPIGKANGEVRKPTVKFASLIMKKILPLINLNIFNTFHKYKRKER